MRDWGNDLEGAILEASKDNCRLEGYVRANVDSVKQLLRGIGPDDTVPSDGAGASIVFNMSCAHVPSFCKDSTGGQTAYKNAYDLNKAGSKRQLVDEVLASVCKSRGVGITKESIYFAAVETTGTGIRFFGDLCLVMRFRPDWENVDSPLSAPTLDQQTLVLERNSYDLVRAPLQADVEESANPDAARVGIVENWVASWSSQLIDMIALRVMQKLPMEERRWTSGEIAGALLEDEDYCEVLFPRSFDVNELVEVRSTSADAAAEGDIADREQYGEGPGLHELQWRDQRRRARKAIAAAGIPVRIVTTSGRVRVK